MHGGVLPVVAVEMGVPATYTAHINRAPLGAQAGRQSQHRAVVLSMDAALLRATYSVL